MVHFALINGIIALMVDCVRQIANQARLVYIGLKQQISIGL